MNFLKFNHKICLIFIRTKLKPPSNIPYAGIYYKDGDTVKQNDLLVVQRRMNYHPGLNVSFNVNVKKMNVYN